MQEIKRIKRMNLIKDYLILTITLMVSAACYNVFLLPLKILSGGSGGIATIIKYTLHVDQSITLAILSIISLTISYLFLGKEKTKATLYVSIACPILVKMTEFLVDIISFSTRDMFIIVIFSGLINGITCGIVYKIGYNSGGLSVISQILHEKFHISLAKSGLVINATIVIIGAYFFGITQAMYALIFQYITKIVIDKTYIGISGNKTFYIVTSESKKVADYVINTLGHSVTYFPVKTGFLSRKKEVLLVIIPTSEYYIFKEGIQMIDKKAFFVATDSYEVKGAH